MFLFDYSALQLWHFNKAWSVAFCLEWFNQRQPPTPKTHEKLICFRETKVSKCYIVSTAACRVPVKCSNGASRGCPSTWFQSTVFLPPKTDKAYADADLQGSSSDSEDELMGQYQEAVSRSQGLRVGGAKAACNAKHKGGFSWESRQKYSPLTAGYDGYSSEASADDGRSCTDHTGSISVCSVLNFSSTYPRIQLQLHKVVWKIFFFSP